MVHRGFVFETPWNYFEMFFYQAWSQDYGHFIRLNLCTSRHKWVWAQQNSSCNRRVLVRGVLVNGVVCICLSPVMAYQEAEQMGQHQCSTSYDACCCFESGLLQEAHTQEESILAWIRTQVLMVVTSVQWTVALSCSPGQPWYNAVKARYFEPRAKNLSNCVYMYTNQ